MDLRVPMKAFCLKRGRLHNKRTTSLLCMRDLECGSRALVTRRQRPLRSNLAMAAPSSMARETMKKSGSVTKPVAFTVQASMKNVQVKFFKSSSKHRCHLSVVHCLSG